MKIVQAFILIFVALHLLSSCQTHEKDALATEATNLISYPADEMSSVPPADKKLPPSLKSEEVFEEENAEYVEEKVKESNAENIQSAATSEVSEKKIIKDGNMSIIVNDIVASKTSLDKLLIKFNAYYESENLYNTDQSISYSLKIRIPYNNFEKLIQAIESGQDEVKNKRIDARDVTEEFIDIESRLENKRAYLIRYKELLAKATQVKDILEIEENIRVLQEEIESVEGRLKYLSNQISLSTLDINLVKEKEFIFKATPKDKFSERLKTSLSNGWHSVVDAVLWLITLWPLMLVLLLILLFIRRFVKRRRIK